MIIKTLHIVLFFGVLLAGCLFSASPAFAYEAKRYNPNYYNQTVGTNYVYPNVGSVNNTMFYPYNATTYTVPSNTGYTQTFNTYNQTYNTYNQTFNTYNQTYNTYNQTYTTYNQASNQNYNQNYSYNSSSGYNTGYGYNTNNYNNANNIPVTNPNYNTTGNGTPCGPYKICF